MILFRTIRSGSSGNCLLLERRRRGRTSRLLIDCGFSSQRTSLAALEGEIGLDPPPAAVLVSHAHSDHINYAALRVLARLGIAAHVHRQARREIAMRHLRPERLPASVDADGFLLATFDEQPFELAGFEVTPIRVPHAPRVTTHGFLLRDGETKLLIASDLHDPEAVVPHIYDCDLIYLESNYDPELLRRYYNPASLFHLANPAAGLLLDHALRTSRRPPRAIMLGHLSADRNRPELALQTVGDVLAQGGSGASVPLSAAPRHRASETVVVRE